MPLYEYQCEACEHRFETIQKFSDAPLTECPKCGGVVHKLQSAPAFHLKGSGWYITDYARKDSAASKDDPKSAAKTEGQPEGKTEAKTEGKTESGADAKNDARKDAKPAAKSDTSSAKSDAAPSKSDS
jgi:putative FmdB family regulatory protein